MSDDERRGQRHGDGRRPGGSLSVSEQFELLSSDRRRAALRYLRARRGETVPVWELADHLATESAKTDRRDVLISLNHLHLPKLVRTGVVTREGDGNLVRYEGHPGLEELLEFVADHR